jgi:hypothetical protein
MSLRAKRGNLQITPISALVCYQQAYLLGRSIHQNKPKLDWAFLILLAAPRAKNAPCAAGGFLWEPRNWRSRQDVPSSSFPAGAIPDSEQVFGM